MAAATEGYGRGDDMDYLIKVLWRAATRRVAVAQAQAVANDGIADGCAARPGV